MRIFFAAALALASATAVSAYPAQRPSDPSSELTRLIGTWTCEGTAPGTSSVEVYAPAGDGSMTLENRVRASTGRAGVVVETFRFDTPSATWTLSAGANAFFGGLHLRAPAWNEPAWVLSGVEVVSGVPRPVRIVYTDLGALGFRREHQVQSGSAWQDDAQLLCRRDAPAAIAVAARPTKAAHPESAPPGPSPVPASMAPTPSAAPFGSATPAASALPAPAPRSAPTPRATPTPHTSDRAYALVGSWACETLARDPGVHTYSLQNDGSLALYNRLRLGTKTFEIHEVYRYDSVRQRWTNDTEHGAYRGSAARWVGDDWTFDGIATERGHSTAVRMSYETLGSSAFRRDFQKLSGLAWTTYASETCARDAARLP